LLPAVAAVVAPLAGWALAEVALGAAPVVAYKDHVGLADGLETFINNPDYGRRVGVALRDRALRVLNLEHVDEEQLLMYRELLASK